MDRSIDFDFSRLPPDILLKIILELPWNQRLHCRRVNNQWLRVCNSALARSTKVINTGEAIFRKASQIDLSHLIPIVADGLESLSLVCVVSRPDIDLSFVDSVLAFRSLREIDIGYAASELHSDRFFQLLDKSPKLKKISGHIPLNLSNSDHPRKEYESIEQLWLLTPDAFELTDLYLMAITDYFPNLSSLEINHYEYMTGFGASTLVEKYGPKLDRLEMRRFGYFPENSSIPAMGVFTGISACSNLTHLALVGSNLTSDEFMSALASGCANLETLDVSQSKLLTDNGLAALAALPKLRKLDISCGARRLDQGVTAIALQGNLTQLVAREAMLTAETIRTCFRYCRGLELVDIRDNAGRIPAEEIMNLWGHYGLQPRLVLRSFDPVWRTRRISKLQEDIENGNNHDHRGRLIIDARYEPTGFLKEGEEPSADETNL